MEALAKSVLAACVDKDKLRHNGHNYFVKNEDLAVDLMTVLSSIQDRLQWELKVNMGNFKGVMTSPTEEEMDEADNDENENDGTNTVKNYNTAIALLGEATQSGYRRIRSELMTEFKLPCDVFCILG